MFEIHITGDEKIIEAAKSLDIKTIVIDLVKPDRSYFRTEYMTSHAQAFDNYEECKAWVDDVVNQLTAAGVKIVRVKIEAPFYKHYIDQSIYFEVHYDARNNDYPMSRNQGKETFLCTAREYDRTKYESLWQKHGGIFLLKPPAGWVMELCLYDSNVEEDKDWFALYENSI